MAEPAFSGIRWIDYYNLEEFYTILETCELYGISKQLLREKSEQYDVPPELDISGRYGFCTHSIRKLHNFIYREDYLLIHPEREETKPSAVSPKKKVNDPWA